MSLRQANSLEVEFVNGTSSSTLKFFHRSGLVSSQRVELKTLTPSGNNVTASSFVFPFANGTNEFIDVEYKVEMENQVEVEIEPVSARRRPGVSKGTYEPVGVPIDSTILLSYRRISVVDSEAAQSSAEASSRKKFELRKEPRAVQYQAGWLVTLVMTLYAFLKYAITGLTYAFNGLTYAFNRLKCGFRNLIPATQSPAPISEPPVEGTDAGWVQRVPAAVSSAINYFRDLRIWTHLRTANPRQSALPR